MEDDRGNAHKRNVPDIQEASDSSPVINLKKRRLEGSTVSTNSFPDRDSSHPSTAENIDHRENIKKNVQVVRNYVKSGSAIDEAVKAIQTLMEILGIDEKKHTKLIVEEGVVSVIIQHLKMNSAVETIPAKAMIMDEWALKLLTSLENNSDFAGRDIIDQEMIGYLLTFFTRRQPRADDALIHRVQLAVLHLFGALLRRSPVETVRALLALQNDGSHFALALLSPNFQVRLSALHVIRDLASTDLGYVNSFCKQWLACQLTVMVSSIHTKITSAAASAIMALSAPHLIDLFLATGLWFAIVALLKSTDDNCRSLGAKLLHTFATGRPGFKSAFTEAGAARSLVQILSIPNLQRDAIIALHSLSTLDGAVACSIVREGGLKLVADIFLSSDVQRDPELAPIVAELLDHLATSVAGVGPFIKSGGLRLLRTTKLYNERSRTALIPACWLHLSLKLMDSRNAAPRILCLAIKESDAGDFIERALCAHALALWSGPFYYSSIFVFNKFLEILLELYASDDPKNHHDGAEALYNIAFRSARFLLDLYHNDDNDNSVGLSVSDILDEAYYLTNDRFGQAQPPPIVQVPDIGLRYLNNPNYDITFLLDNKTKQFQAHQCVLMEASDVFRAMLSNVDIADRILEVHNNISHSTFVSVMQFVYTGRLQYSRIDDVYAILEAADFYGLDCLMKVCEYLIAREHMVVEKVADVYDFAELHHSKLLMHVCILFILEYHEQVCSLPSFRTLVERIIPEIRLWFLTIIPDSQLTFPLGFCGF